MDPNLDLVEGRRRCKPQLNGSSPWLGMEARNIEGRREETMAGV